MRPWIILAIGLLPHSRMKTLALRCFGYRLSRGVTLQPCFILRVDKLVMHEESRIGFFTVLRDLTDVHVGPHAIIGQWNWFSSARPLTEEGAPGTLKVGAHSAVSSRHYLDCSGGIQIGDYTTVAGCRSTFITHGINVRQSRQTWLPIEVGDYCLIGSNASLCPGAAVPDRCVVGMGATIGRGDSPPDSLLMGPRATAVKTNLDGDYFTRTEGYIYP